MNLDHKIYKKIKIYLNNEMTHEELIVFEKEIASNEDLKDTVSVLKKMDAIYSDDDWAIIETDSSKLNKVITLFKNNEITNFSKKIKKAERNYKKKLPKKIRRLLLYASSVAAIGLILFTGYFLKADKSSQDLYVQYYTIKDLPSFSLKNNDLNELTKAELLFKEKKYTAALALLESIEKTNNEINPNLILYLAQVNSELNNNTEALNYLEQLQNSNTIDQHKSYWFKALIYLKEDNKEKAIATLNVLTQNINYFNHEKALSLLDELK